MRPCLSVMYVYLGCCYSCCCYCYCWWWCFLAFIHKTFFCTATEITFIYFRILCKFGSGSVSIASKQANEQAYHLSYHVESSSFLFWSCLPYFCHNKFVGRFYSVCLCGCRIYVLLHSLHTACCERSACVCIFLSMHFTSHRYPFFRANSISRNFVCRTFIRKSISFHLLRSVHAYYFSDYIKINGCSRERKKKFATCRVCLKIEMTECRT